MNPNPFPHGRWTVPCRQQQEPSSTKLRPRRGFRSAAEPPAALRQAPLRELFWAAENSSLVTDARDRIDAALADAATAEADPPFSR